MKTKTIKEVFIFALVIAAIMVALSFGGADFK